MEQAEAVRTEDVDALRPRLLRAAMRLGHAPNEAEDLVQETLLAFVRGADRFEGRASLYSWLYRVLVNRHVDLLRARDRDRRIPRAPAAPAPDAHELAHVRATLARLPEREHHVLVMRFFEELPYDEVARALDVSVGTAHALAFSGLQRLRALLEEDRP